MIDRSTNNELIFDRSAAERFLAAIGRGATRFTFQTFDDNKERRDAHAAANARRKKEGKKKLPSPFVRVLHGSLDQHFTKLVRLNDMGAGVFATINRTNLHGRTAEDVVEVRWLFIDLDGNPLPTEGPRPHLVVETSPGHWHVYWKVDGVGLDEFKAKQMALLARHGGDKVINYLNCVLRVPGFLHRKQEPRLIRIVEINDIPPYRADDFPSATEEPRHRGNGDANGGDRVEFPDRAGGEIDHDALEWAMREMPNLTLEEVGGDVDDPRYFDRDRWLAVLMALHRTYGGDPRGFNPLEAWTVRNPNYASAEARAKAAEIWASFDGSPSGPPSKVRKYTAATVFWMAEQASPGWRDRYHADAERRTAEANRNDDYQMAEIAAALAAEGKSLETAVAEASCANAGAGASHVRTLSPRKARGSSTDADATPAGAGATCTSINTNTNNAPNNGNAGADAKPAVAPPDGEPASAAPNASKPSDDDATQAGAAAEPDERPASAALKVKATTKAVKPTGRPTLTALPQTLAEAGGGGGFDRDQIVNGVNRRHALVLAGNKAAVMKFEADGKTFRLISVDAFKTWHLNRAITLPGDNGKPKRITHAELWLNDRDRREYEGIEFAPAGGKAGYYNLWQGFAVEPREGDCGKFLAHIRDNIAQGNTFLYNWVIGFFAQIAQQPDVKIGTALALRGEPGVGKTKVGEVFGFLLKPHYKLVADPRFVTGQFNSHMASLLLLHADEAFWAGDKRSEGKLKDLVTGSEHFLEFKGVDPISVRNLIRLFVTGNSDWLVPAAFRERRWAVIDAGVGKIQDHAYFAAIDHEMDHGGREALLHHLLHFDLKTVNLRAIPETKALLEQKFASASAEEKFWLDTLKYGRLPGALEGEPSACRKKELYDAYIRHARRTGVSHRSIQVKVGMFLTDYVPGLVTDQKVTITATYREPKQVPAYKFPALADCRRAFEAKIKQAVDWGADDVDWQADNDRGDEF